MSFNHEVSATTQRSLCGFKLFRHKHMSRPGAPKALVSKWRSPSGACCSEGSQVAVEPEEEPPSVAVSTQGALLVPVLLFDDQLLHPCTGAVTCCGSWRTPFYLSWICLAYTLVEIFGQVPCSHLLPSAPNSFSPLAKSPSR
eukprot:2194020-Amphidinium_carterae.1